MSRLVLIALASFWLTGCFVFDEIRKGNELMDQHASPARRKKAAEAAAQAEAAEEKASQAGSIRDWTKAKDRLAEWWSEAIEEDPIAPDPDDHITRCEVNGQVRFTRKSQCEIRGGRMTGDYSKDKRGT